MATSPTSQLEPESTTESAPMPGPTTIELFIPTLTLFIVGFLVFLVLYCVSHRQRLLAVFTCNKRIEVISIENDITGIPNKNESFLTARDLYALKRLENFQNNIYGLLKICIAPSVSLIACPLSLLLYEPIVNYCWPKSEFPMPPNINDAIGCFLVPAGMVYAFMFGFAFQHVYHRHTKIEDNIQEKVGIMRELVWILKTLNGLSAVSLLEVLDILKEQLINELLQVQGINDQIRTDTWSILLLLNKTMDKADRISGHNRARKVNTVTYMDHLQGSAIDAALYREIMRCLRTLRTLTDSGLTQAGMPLFHWLFLEILGYFSFLGVLLVSAQSYHIQLAMCVVTVASISLLCFAVSDLDSPFHGFLRVDLSVISSMVMELQMHARNLGVVHLTDVH